MESLPVTPIAIKGPIIKLEENLWAKAKEKFSEKERKGLEFPDVASNNIIENVLGEVKNNEKKVSDKRWKFHTRHGDVALRDYFLKMSKWAQKFIQIGDTLVQYDPAHAALPWAGVRLILSISANDSETYEGMAVGIEEVCGTITRYAIFESHYLLEASAARAQLVEAMVKLYVAVLKYLIATIRYYKKRTADRAFESILKSARTAVDEPLAQIRAEQATVNDLAKLVDAELQRKSDKKSSSFQEATQATLHQMRKSSERMLNSLESIDSLIGEVTGLRVELRDRQRLGCGKTKIVSVIIESFLKDREANLISPSVAFFYCNKSETQRTKPEEILRAIAKQLLLASSEDALREPFTRRFAEQEDKAEQDSQGELAQLSLKETANLIVDLLEGYPAIIIIDALDECDAAGRPALLKELADILERSKANAKMLLSGRENIGDELPEAQFHTDIQINANDNYADITRFIQFEVEAAITDKSLLNGKVTGELKQEITDKLGDGAQGMFLWVNLQLQNLCDKHRMKSAKDVKRELGRINRGIEGLYKDIYQQQIEGLARDSREDAQAVFKWLLCAREPLSTGALLEAVSTIVDDEIKIPEKEMILQICANLIMVDNETDTFRFSHLSVQEFLEKNSEYSSSVLHAFAARRCIDEFLLDRRLLRDSSSGKVSDDQSFHSYAVRSWTTHFSSISIEDRQDESLNELIQDFLLNDESFNTFHREALKLKVSASYCGIQKETDSLLSAKSTCIFAICMFGLDGLLEELDDQEHIDWNQKNEAGDTPLHLSMANGHESMVRFLLGKADLVIGERGAYGESALGAAALGGHTAVGQLLLNQNDVDVDTVNHRGQSPLILAASTGHDEFVQLLLDKKANKEIKDDLGRTALLAAAESGHKKVVRILLKAGADSTTTDFDGRTALHVAILWAANQYDDVVQQLLREKVDFEIHDQDGATPLHVAARGNEEKVVNMLIEKKAVVSAKDLRGKTPLDYAAHANSERIIKELLKHGATFEADLDGRTEIMEAVQGGCSIEILKLFIDKGADVTTRTTRGETALEFAAQRTSEMTAEVVQLLLEAGAELNVTNSDGETMLHHAARGGSIVVLNVFLDRDLNIAAKNSSGQTALTAAVHSGNEAAARTLLKHGASMKDIDNQGFSLLHHSVSSDNLALVKLVLEEKSVDVIGKTEFGDTPLELAVHSGNYPIVCILLENGAGRHSYADGETTPLHRAAESFYTPQQGKLIESLINAGFSVNAKDQYGCTPLHLAVKNGYRGEGIVELLLNHGADIASKDENGDVAMHHLAKSYHKSEKILCILLSKGADVNVLNNEGSTPLANMVAGDHEACVQLLLDHGADVTMSNGDLDTPLHFAAIDGSEAVVKALLATDVDIAVRDSAGETPLHLASRYNSIPVLGLLLEHGADIQAKRSDGWTPLHAAVYVQDGKSMRFLIENGADIMAVDDTATSPLHTACSEECLAVDFLLEKGGDLESKTNAGLSPLNLTCRRQSVANVRVLVARGADTLSKDTSNDTPLHEAARNSNADIALCALSSDRTTEVDIKNDANDTPLTLAAWKGNLKTVQALLARKDCSPGLVSGEGCTALALAARSGYPECVEELFKADPTLVTNRDKWGRDAFSLGAESGNLAVVELLLKADGVKVNEPDKRGFTPLMWAGCAGKLEVFELLLKQEGVQLNHKNDEGANVLHCASLSGNEPTVKKLLESDCIDMNSRNKFDETPLHIACMEGHTDVAHTLLSRPDIDVNARNFLGSSALSLALQNECNGIALELLERDDVDVNFRNQVGVSAIYHAAFYGYEEVVQNLLARKELDVSLLSTSSPTISPLHRAADGGYETIVKMLLDHEAVEVNVRGGCDRTPLWYAAREGWEGAAAILLEHNADIDAADEDGDTPLCVAAQHGQIRVVDLLLEKGAKEKLDEALELTSDMEVAMKLREFGAKDLYDFLGLKRLFGDLDVSSDE